MKRVFLFSGIALLSVCVSAQQIEGLGELKLGLAVNDFEQWVKQEGGTIEEVRDSMEMYRGRGASGMKVYIPMHNEEKSFMSPSGVNYVPGYKSYVINSFSPSGIKVSNVTLIFKNDALVHLQADLTDVLEDALTAKYGKPVEKLESKEITCAYKLTGATMKKSENVKYSTWRDDSIKAYGTANYYYDSKCELSGYRNIAIQNKAEYSDYLSRNFKAKAAYEESQKNGRLNELKKKLDKL